MDTGNIKLIKQGYADLFSDLPQVYNDRCLQFRAIFQDQAEACKAVRLIKSYNEFSGAKVAAKLAELWNNILWIEFGREYSPVLYVVAKRGFEQDIIAALRSTKPNEVRIEGETTRIRFWWD